MTLDLGDNRYTANTSLEESIDEIDNDSIILNIMRQEYPNDLFYAFGSLTPPTPAEQALATFNGPGPEVQKDHVMSPRNGLNIAQARVDQETYIHYDLHKSYPTIDEDALDEIIDEEWDTFEDPDDGPVVPIILPADNGLFLANSETDLTDVHDLYIQYGPQTIGADGNDISDITSIFCIFYIQNGKARPIPNYKTLEVMLVERGQTYGAIKGATGEQMQKYDLLLDGEIDETNSPESSAYEDLDMSPIDEFLDRTMNDRSPEWSKDVRFRSGYIPKAPFKRDPGDYIKPESMRAIEGRVTPIDPDTGEELPPDIFVTEDPNDRYFDQVFKSQTWKESLRVQYEGKMVIGEWSQGYQANVVENNTSVLSDDLVLSVRMMINGHWKQIRESQVFRLYAAINEIDISDLSPVPKRVGVSGDTVGGLLGAFGQGEDVGEDRYGADGLINLLIERGGITTLAGTTQDPIWSAFSHIVEADDDGISGLDIVEYQEYLDVFTNGGDPFGVEMLQPYEPAGSIHYYPEVNYNALIAQAVEQAEIDAIKDSIFELWPSIAANADAVKVQVDSMPGEFVRYVQKRLGGDDGNGALLYKIWISKSGNWKYVKKKRKKLKRKKEHKRLFKLINKSYRIKANLSEDEENKIVSRYKWMKSVSRDKFAGWMNGNANNNTGNAVGSGVAGAVALTGTGLAIATAAAANAGYAAVLSSALAAGVFGPAASVSATAIFTGTTTGFLGSGTAAILTNPITIGAAAGVALFFIADALIGEVPADEYILPPWRFMDDNWYFKACVYNEIDDFSKEAGATAAYVDSLLPQVRDTVNQIHTSMGNIDQALLNADTSEEFQEIYDALMSLKEYFDDFNSGGLLNEISGFRQEVDEYFIKQLKAQYDAIQYVRKKVHKKVGGKKKFGIVWPTGPQKILNEYIPGLTFDNYLPG